jgi:Tol biopolymer transport system component
MYAQKSSRGVFEGNSDIGDVLIKGSVTFDSLRSSYTIEGGGENMWYAIDAFHYVWKKASHDVAMSANISFIGMGGDAHKKAGLIIRQNLEPDAPYADAIIHGDGLTSLQYREVKGGPTREIQSNIRAPKTIKIQKEGHYVFMSIAPEGGDLRSSGGSFRIKFEEPFLIGLGVCSHNNKVSEKAIFSSVEITTGSQTVSGEPRLESTMETIAIDSKDRKAVYTTTGFIEGAFWLKGTDSLFFSKNGQLYTIPRMGGTPKLFNTDTMKNLGSSNGFSPDGKQLALSNYIGEHQAKIFIMPASGGEPKLLTRNASSWWHNWSPDGKSVLFAGMRNKNLDIYSIPVSGGEENRLTNHQGMNDGPEFSPDGKYIYFNSDRSGANQIWRMKPDGSSPEQLTSDEYSNWFPHVSPDGQWIVFLSYEKNVQGHPSNQDVMLRLLPTAGGTIDVLAKLFGGQGTFDVNSWSQDSNNLTFISFRLIRQ